MKKLMLLVVVAMLFGGNSFAKTPDEFTEYAVTVGGYSNSGRGLYGLGEMNHWKEVPYAGRNISLLGARVIAGHGEHGGNSFRNFSLLYQPAWYEVLDKVNDTSHLLLKGFFGISGHYNDFDNQTNPAAGGYLELDKTISPVTWIGITAEGLHEFDKEGESWATVRGFVEHMFDNTLKLQFNAGPIYRKYGEDNSESGMTVGAILKKPMVNGSEHRLGVTYDTSGDGTVGVYYSYAFNEILSKKRR